MIASGPDVVSWVTRQLGLPEGAYGPRAVGFGEFQKGALVGAVVFSNFNGHHVHIHAASDGRRTWLTRSMLTMIFRYPFSVLGVKRLTATMDARNERSRALVERLGFSRMATLPESSNEGGDLMIYQMARPDCRWLSLV